MHVEAIVTITLQIASNHVNQFKIPDTLLKDMCGGYAHVRESLQSH